MDDHQRGWLEALIDSEGCLSIHHNTAVLIVSNTNKAFLERAAEIIGAGRIYCTRPATSNQRQQWQLHLYSRALRRLLPELHLIVKEEQRRLVLQVANLVQWVKRRGSTGEYARNKISTLREQVKLLNRRP